MKQRQHFLFQSAVMCSPFIAALFGPSCRVIQDRPIVSSSWKNDFRLTGQNTRHEPKYHLTPTFSHICEDRITRCLLHG